MMGAVAVPALAARKLSYTVEAGRALRDPAEIGLELGPEPARALIRLGAGASARVVLRLSAAPDARGDLASAIELDLAPGADLELAIYSALPAGFFRDASLQAVLGEGAALRLTEACLDRGPGRHLTELELAGLGAAVDLAGAYAAAGRTEREHEVSMRHAARDTKGRIAQASVLAGAARLRFTGLIRVLPGAAGTDAFLANRNLILDDGARAESLPQLRIEHDEVQCSHGSTSGGPDPEQLLYLRSRGLGFAEARSMIAMGHLGAVFARLPEAFAAEAEAAAAELLLGGAFE